MELVTYVGWLAALLAVVCIGAALAQPWAGRRGLVVLLVPLALAVTAFGVLEGDWMGQLRFATPVWPLGALAAVVAAVHVVPQLSGRGRRWSPCSPWSPPWRRGWRSRARPGSSGPRPPRRCASSRRTPAAPSTRYARLAGARDATVLAPDLGGSALTSDLRIVDLVGLADSRIARYWAAGDLAGLRDHVFVEVRPTFITSNGDWSRETGLPADPRLAADYVEIATSATGVTDWVRRDALPPGALDAMRGYALTTAAAADAEARRSPRASCGDVLVPGAG